MSEPGYRHTQVGLVIVCILLGGILVCGVLLWPLWGRPTERWVIIGVLALLGIVLGLIHSLTVTVDEQALRFHFGPGVIHGKFLLADIASCESVRNPWFVGFGVRWGIRWWLFNVSGLDAVELRLHNGKRYRIGTDEPASLVAAIRANLPPQPAAGEDRPDEA